LFRSLVTPERTRAIVERADLEHLGAKHAELDRVIDNLVAARLLVVQTGEDGEASIEIVHESLIARWPALRRWLDEDHEDAAFVAQVTAAAKPWDAQGRPQGLLWRGDVIDDAMRRDRARPQQLAGRERAFLDAGFATSRRTKRNRSIAMVASIAVLGFVAAFSSAQYVRTLDAENKAQVKADEAGLARDDAERKTDALLKEIQRREAADAARLAADQRLTQSDADKRAAIAAQAAAEADAARSSVVAATAQTKIDQALGAKLSAEIEAARNATTADERQRALDRLIDELRKQRGVTESARIAADQARTKLDNANAKLKAQLDAATAKQATLESEIKNLKLSTTLKGLKQ
jgi:hypothetical protein